MYTKYIPAILAVLLYLLIYFLRLQQVDDEFKNRANSLDLFPQVRLSLDKKIQSFLQSPQAELLSGILLGNKKDLPAQLKLALRDSATLHIVVVSGQNLTLLAALVMGLAGLFKRKTVILACLLIIVFYTLLTGAQVPVIRAAIMAILAFGAQFFGRVRDGVWMLICAAAIMLAINPFWIADLSFQLSFLATLGVIAVSPVFLQLLKHLPEVLKTDLSVTLASQLMVLPIVASNFHQISMVSLLANVMVLWTVPFIMIVGAVNLTLALIWPPLAILFSPLTHILLTYFIYIVQFFASLSFAWEYIGEMGWMVWLGYYLILAAVVLSLNYAKKSTGE